MFDIIFDTLFDFFSTWEALGLLLMGTVFIAVGALFIGYEIYWRVKSERISGRISAVKKNGQYYHSIFDYHTKDGNHYEQTSTLGSSSILNRIPGIKLSLMIMPDNPNKVRRPTFIWLIFGIVFLLPGLFIMDLAIKKFELNYMMVLFIFAILLFGGEKIFHFYKKITRSTFDRALLKEAWIELKKGRAPKSPVQDVKGRILEKYEIIKKAKEHLRWSKVTALVLFALSIGLCYGAYYSGKSMIDMTRNGISTKGIVIGIESRDNSDGSGYTYYANIRFTDKNGEEQQFTDGIGASTPLFERGEAVDVLYKSLSPDNAMIDRGIFNWLISLGAAVLSIWTLWGAYIFLTAERRFNKINLLQN